MTVVPSPGADVMVDAAVMGLDDRGDDRQPETGAARRARCARCRRGGTDRRRAPASAGDMPWPSSATVTMPSSPDRPDGDRADRVRAGCGSERWRAGCRSTCRSRLGVAGDDHDVLDPQVHHPLGRDGVGGVDGVDHEIGEVDGRRGERATLVELREQRAGPPPDRPCARSRSGCPTSPGPGRRAGRVRPARTARRRRPSRRSACAARARRRRRTGASAPRTPAVLRGRRSRWSNAPCSRSSMRLIAVARRPISVRVPCPGTRRSRSVSVISLAAALDLDERSEAHPHEPRAEQPDRHDGAGAGGEQGEHAAARGSRRSRSSERPITRMLSSDWRDTRTRSWWSRVRVERCEHGLVVAAVAVGHRQLGVGEHGRVDARSLERDHERVGAVRAAQLDVEAGRRAADGLLAVVGVGGRRPFDRWVGALQLLVDLVELGAGDECVGEHVDDRQPHERGDAASPRAAGRATTRQLPASSRST